MLTIYRLSKCSQSVDILFLCCGSVAFTKHCHNHYSFKSNRYCHTSLLTCFRCCDSMHVLLLTQTTVHVMVSLKFSLFFRRNDSNTTMEGMLGQGTGMNSSRESTPPTPGNQHTSTPPTLGTGHLSSTGPNH